MRARRWCSRMRRGLPTRSKSFITKPVRCGGTKRCSPPIRSARCRCCCERDRPQYLIRNVICSYLDTLHTGRKLIPTEGEARWRALQVQAVAQGLSDAGIAIRWETQRRPKELRYPALRDGYVEKLLASYDWLEQELDTEGAVDIGHIALATALSWLEFRELPTFRHRPRLTRWFNQFSNRDSMVATPLWGQTHD